MKAMTSSKIMRKEQTMSRWIDVDEIENAKFQEENLRGMGEHIAYRVGWNEAIESILENAPSIDLVRCGECKWLDSGKNDSEIWSICTRHFGKYFDVNADDFCSYGDKRDD